jgi:hypothetical protein
MDLKLDERWARRLDVDRELERYKREMAREARDVTRKALCRLSQDAWRFA